MSSPVRSPALACAVILAAAVPSFSFAQTLPPIRARDSVTIKPSDKYEKGAIHRFLFGDNYRDIWATPVKAPVLDLADFAGGLTPTETGGGMQTRSLRFKGADGREYAFRPVYKALLDLPDSFRGTIIWNLVMDARSASHPTAPVSAPPILTAAGILQAPAALVALPDDARLGQFRQEFGGVLGTIEERPDVPDNNPSAAFAGAENIEDGEDMLERINEEPEKINARTFLKAVLVDALLNDNDRHAGQWSWARLEEGGAWQPIPRDRDKVFIDYEGFLVGLGRGAAPTLVRFGATYPRLSDLFDNAVEFERRMLNGLEKPVWDSVVAELKAAITDDVLEAAIAAQPPEYAATNREILATLKARRANLQGAADKYYAYMAHTVDLHATDKNEVASVVRGEGGVTVTIREADKQEPYFTRRFNAGETREIRLYMHEGGRLIALLLADQQREHGHHRDTRGAHGQQLHPRQPLRPGEVRRLAVELVDVAAEEHGAHPWPAARYRPATGSRRLTSASSLPGTPRCARPWPAARSRGRGRRGASPSPARRAPSLPPG